MKALPIFWLIAVLAMSGCDDGSWALEKQALEEKLSAAENRAVELWDQLEAEKAKTEKMETIRDLAEEAHDALQELNIAALQFPASDNAESNQSAAILLLMLNDRAKEACEKLYNAFQEKQ